MSLFLATFALSLCAPLISLAGKTNLKTLAENGQEKSGILIGECEDGSTRKGALYTAHKIGCDLYVSLTAMADELAMKHVSIKYGPDRQSLAHPSPFEANVDEGSGDDKYMYLSFADACDAQLVAIAVHMNCHANDHNEPQQQQQQQSLPDPMAPVVAAEVAHEAPGVEEAVAIPVSGQEKMDAKASASGSSDSSGYDNHDVDEDKSAAAAVVVAEEASVNNAVEDAKEAKSQEVVEEIVNDEAEPEDAKKEEVVEEVDAKSDDESDKKVEKEGETKEKEEKKVKKTSRRHPSWPFIIRWASSIPINHKFNQ